MKVHMLVSEVPDNRLTCMKIKKHLCIYLYLTYLSMVDVWFGQYLKICNLRVQKNLNIEKIIFKVVQGKSPGSHMLILVGGFYTPSQNVHKNMWMETQLTCFHSLVQVNWPNVGNSRI